MFTSFESYPAVTIAKAIELVLKRSQHTRHRLPAVFSFLFLLCGLLNPFCLSTGDPSCVVIEVICVCASLGAHTHTLTPFLGMVGVCAGYCVLAWAFPFPFGVVWCVLWCDDLTLVLELVSEGAILGGVY